MFVVISLHVVCSVFVVCEASLLKVLFAPTLVTSWSMALCNDKDLLTLLEIYYIWYLV